MSEEGVFGLSVISWLVFTLCMTAVNVAVAQEKKRNVWGILFLSLFFTLFVYLYLLAVPEKKTSEWESKKVGIAGRIN